MKKEIKKIDIKEFREKGYLQELNRRFLHPLGLALEIRQRHDGTEILGEIWDYREEEGYIMILQIQVLNEKKDLKKIKFLLMKRFKPDLIFVNRHLDLILNP